MNRLPCSALLFALLCALSLPAFGWSLEGHRLVGELAERRLSEATKRKVARLLAGEEDPTLAGVAGWADEIRDDPSSELGRISRPWHYINFDRDADCRYERAVCLDGNCVVGAIARQRDILADPDQPIAERRNALKFLVHFVGDVHQPMHAGLEKDRGGNSYQIQLRARTARDGGEGTNLHRVWDHHVLASAGLPFRDHADDLERRLSWLAVDASTDQAAPARWAIESCRLIAGGTVYPRGSELSDAYLDHHRMVAEGRVMQAAMRLAALLEDALGGTAGR